MSATQTVGSTSTEAPKVGRPRSHSKKNADGNTAQNAGAKTTGTATTSRRLSASAAQPATAGNTSLNANQIRNRGSGLQGNYANAPQIILDLVGLLPQQGQSFSAQKAGDWLQTCGSMFRMMYGFTGQIQITVTPNA